MASYQVLPAPGPGLGAAMGEGIGSYAVAAGEDYWKRKKKERERKEGQERLSKYAKFAKEAGLEQTGMTFDEEGNVRYSYKADDKDKVPSFDEMIRKAVSGETPYKEVRKTYPTKYQTIREIQQQSEPMEMVEGFTEGTGGPISHLGSLFSGKQAELSEGTKTVISNINNRYDLEEFLAEYERKPDEFIESGVDIKAIKEYFGIR